jgi:hypothetical protein
MRFFASWWERFPKSQAAALVAAAVAVGGTAHRSGLLHLLVLPTGFGWG